MVRHGKTRSDADDMFCPCPPKDLIDFTANELIEATIIHLGMEGDGEGGRRRTDGQKDEQGKLSTNVRKNDFPVIMHTYFEFHNNRGRSTWKVRDNSLP